MKKLLQQYAAYNLWANEEISRSINVLSHDQQHQEIISSFNTLYKTVFHIWRAEKLWMQRLQKEKNINAPPDDFNQSMKALTLTWKQQDQEWLDWVERANNQSLERILTYCNLKGDEFCQPVFLVLHHVFNHSTYHRGQLVTMLRQVGLEKIPSTDFIAWALISK
jgi:uncharacterized damage-inducible protein DinB